MVQARLVMLDRGAARLHEAASGVRAQAGLDILEGIWEIEDVLMAAP